jgi:hypothetical protein
MSCDSPWVSVKNLSAKLPLSLAHVRWIRESEEEDENGDICVSCAQMFDVVGEQHRLSSVAAARQAITEEGAFVPPVFWLVPDNCNAHDANAVAVYSIVKTCGVHVGFLPRGGAVHFRDSMNAIGRPGETLEVRGCITQSKSGPHPNVRLNLPWSFAELVAAGFVDDPANIPDWLSDGAPVLKRPYVGPRAAGFSDAELCKIYCWYGHQNGWFLLPDAVESEARGFRASGIGSLHKVLQFFEESIEDAVVADREWATYNHNSEAKAFAKEVIRDHLSENMTPEEVKAEFKGTSIRGQLQDMGRQVYEIEWVRLSPQPETLCRINLQKVGDAPDAYELRAIEFVDQ